MQRDRREVNVLITPEGEKILRQLSMHHRAELRRMGPELVASLENIVDHIDAPTPALSVSGR